MEGRPKVLQDIAQKGIFPEWEGKKLEAASGDTPYIQTHVGIGYIVW